MTFEKRSSSKSYESLILTIRSASYDSWILEIIFPRVSWLCLTTTLTFRESNRRTINKAGPMTNVTKVRIQSCQNRTHSRPMIWTVSRIMTVTESAAPERAMVDSFTNFELMSPVDTFWYWDSGQCSTLLKSSFRSVTNTDWLI